MEYDQKMKHPSNGVSILGCLRPAYADEESYIRRLFYFDEGEDYNTEWKGNFLITMIRHWELE